MSNQQNGLQLILWDGEGGNSHQVNAPGESFESHHRGNANPANDTDTSADDDDPRVRYLPALLKGTMKTWEMLLAAGVNPATIHDPTPAIVGAIVAGFETYFRQTARDTPPGTVVTEHDFLKVDQFADVVLDFFKTHHAADATVGAEAVATAEM